VTDSARPQLFGFWMCLALVVGNSIGSGIFLLPAALAAFGLNSLYAWGFTATGAILLAVVFSRLSRAFPQAGGPYAYVERAFGPLPAFIVAWGYWVSIWVGNATIATGGVSYLADLIPWIGSSSARSAGVTLAILWILTFVNWFGIRASGWVQSVTTVLKLTALFAIVVLGVIEVRPHHFSMAAQTPISLPQITAAATLALWALLGLESATIPADRVVNPTRTIPAATMVGTILTALICAIACTTVLLLLPRETLEHSNAPFADLVAHFWGPGAGRLLAVFAAISAFGCLNGWVLLQAELPRAMALHRVFPRVFAHLSSRGTADFGLFFGSLLVSALLLTNYQHSMVIIFTKMALLSTTACLVLYVVCSLALLRLQWLGQLGDARRGTVGVAIVGVLAAGYSLWAIVGAGSEAIIWGLGLLLVGLPVYWFTGRARAAA
jgi:basic amino acid/polyamine antiporter, APA family